MPIKGLTIEQEHIIKSILEPYKSKYKFYFYGSRVKGDFRPLSDLDILLECCGKIDINDIEDVKNKFDASSLPFVVNLSYDVDEEFYSLIKNDLVEV